MNARECFSLGRASANLGSIFSLYDETNKKVSHEPYTTAKTGPPTNELVSHMMGSKLTPPFRFFTDAATAYKAFFMDRPSWEVEYFVVNHSDAKRFGFVWWAVLDEEEGYSSEEEIMVLISAR